MKPKGGRQRICFIVIKSELVLIITKECSGGHGGKKKTFSL